MSRRETDPQELRTWLDKQALTELVAVLSSAVDRADHDRIADCYAEGSYDDHGAFKGSGAEFADFICTTGKAMPMHHLLGQSVFDVQGDEAWGETSFAFHILMGTRVHVGYGRYVDHFRRDEGRWRITYRRVVPDHVIPGDDRSSYWASARDGSDPLYDRRRGPDT